MIVLSIVLIVSAIIFCLALAASSSPVYGFNAKAELASMLETGGREPHNRATADFVPLQQSMASEAQPVVSAAGMQ